jgi:two-component system, LuxR family, sensor kinase FixL
MGGRTEEPDSSRLLSRRYLVVLALVALLVLLDRAMIQPPLLRLLTDAPTINLAGRQRMLSQRLAKAALALDAARSPDQRRQWRDELGETLVLWTRSHDRLRVGNTAAVRAAFDRLDPCFARMRESATRRFTSGDDKKDLARASLDAILASEPEYLRRMDHIVGLFEREAQARVDRLIWTGWGVTALVIVALAAVGQFVLRPAARVIDRQLARLRDARDQLDARVRERTRALEQANRDLAREAAERSRAEERHRVLVEQFSHVARTTVVSEMAAGLAHELNQPLGAIANYAEGCLVALDEPAPTRDELRAVIGKILTTTLRAGAIVQSIRRSVTRHGAAREAYEPNRIAREVEEFFRDAAQRRGATLQLELAPDLPCLYGDPVQIQQVLVNLVRNALDALTASQTPHPTVVMWTKQVAAGDVEFGVRDNGEGIPGERLPRIFDAFFSTRDEGMGMGLAISRTIVEAHQGRIHVESSPGSGATFWFRLPVAGELIDADAEDSGADGLHR